MDSVAQSRGHVAIRLIKYWVPVAVMLAAMFYFSTDRLSSASTETVVGKILKSLMRGAGDDVIAAANYIVRKSAHFTEYAILGALLFRAFRSDDPVRWRLQWAVFSLLAAGLWAALDEFHQTFTQTRSGSALDSLLDATGALFALIVVALLNRRTRASSTANQM